MDVFIESNSLIELLLAHTGNFLEHGDIRYALPPRPLKGNKTYIATLFCSYKAQNYYKQFNWHISLIGSTAADGKDNYQR